MAISWSEQTCLLTGATGGIGQAIATKLAERGVSLILTGRDTARLSEMIETLPGQHTVICADLSVPEDMNKVVLTSRQHALTMLINNAGVTHTGNFSLVSPQDIDQVLQTNLIAPMTLTAKLLPYLKQSSQGHIINVGSTFGSIGFPCHALYSASKFGLRGWTEALARENAGTDLRIRYFAPRATKTAINSDQVTLMNEALGNTMDSPQYVADEFINMLESRQPRWFVGFPEKLFVRINGAMPSLVDKALRKKLPTIQRYISPSNKESVS